jgi:hypothetical protein
MYIKCYHHPRSSWQREYERQPRCPDDARQGAVGDFCLRARQILSKKCQFTLGFCMLNFSFAERLAASKYIPRSLDIM